MDAQQIKIALKKVYPTHPEEIKYYRQHYYRYHDTLMRIPLPYIEERFVIDLGAIPGHLTRAIKILGANKVIGFDYDPERFGFLSAFAKSGITLLKCDLRNSVLPLESESVDSILFTEVIEHIPNPEFLIKELHRVLKPQGKLIITTPNIGNLANRIRHLLKLPIYPSSEHMGERAEQQHVHEYTMHELQSLFTNKGFIIVKADYIAGTEKALIFNTMPTKFPWPLGALYGLAALLFPSWRSYLFLTLKKGTPEIIKN